MGRGEGNESGTRRQAGNSLPDEYPYIGVWRGVVADEMEERYDGWQRLEIAEELLDRLYDDPRFCEEASADLLSAIGKALGALEEGNPTL